MKKTILLITGCVSLSLGFVGIFVPLLPTTPFLLLAATCFMRSSESLYCWIMNHKIFGNYVRNYQQFKSISKRAKVVTLCMLWIFIGYSILLVAQYYWIRIMLIIIAIGVTVHILSLRTLKPKKPQ